ncbi:MAG: sigma-54-dependent Fis family transcriptional regulator [Spirochaetales bacterium]|nr:sigma-54-dependent Fis family transcriptional regulator [Spirochaetales bacterium]
MSTRTKEKTILVVDDAIDTLEVIKRNLTDGGYRVFTAAHAAGAIELLDRARIDLVITDMKMPGVSGSDLIRHVRENHRDAEIIAITGYPSIQGAVSAVKTGAFEYLPKPFTDTELMDAVGKALDNLSLRQSIRSQLAARDGSPLGLIGESESMRQVFRAVEKAATAPATVLVSGESGTGKELVARAVHYTGARASAPFVPVNCGGIPESLLESELFGYVKGAFTGAFETRAGFFQTADAGTIFLDEISEMGLTMQVKLLRVLQDREVYMIASRRPQKVDVRIVASTNKHLPDVVKKGLFREDLFYRLNVISITLPPLRERGDDILLLIHYFVNRFSREANKPAIRFSTAAMHILKNYFWPGNVRELENLVQCLVIMAENELIDSCDLPSLMRFSANHRTGFTRTLADVECDYIRNVLASVNGNKTKASKILGIDRKTLRDKTG